MYSVFALNHKEKNTYLKLFSFQGRFTIAAKHHITTAEIYESELVDIEKVSKFSGVTEVCAHYVTQPLTEREVKDTEALVLDLKAKVKPI